MVIQIQVYVSNGLVIWRLYKIRPARDWRSMGPWYWERRGEVELGQEPLSDRAALTAALTAMLTRLGEREHLGGGGE